MTIPILHHDDDVVVVVKPAGMFVHRSPLDPHETVFLLQTLRNQIGQYLYPVHRLDRPTSGVMLFALNKEAARYLKPQFDNGETEKQYLAVVRGWVNEQIIDYSLSVTFDDIADRNRSRDKSTQTAISHVIPLAKIELPFVSSVRYPTSRYSLVQLIPKTGRKHQLRRHMKHIFHPIIGDTAYGDLRQNKAFAEHLGIQRLMLHAQSLSFRHPQTGQWLTYVAPPEDQSWQQILAEFTTAFCE